MLNSQGPGTVSTMKGLQNILNLPLIMDKSLMQRGMARTEGLLFFCFFQIPGGLGLIHLLSVRLIFIRTKHQ